MLDCVWVVLALVTFCGFDASSSAVVTLGALDSMLLVIIALAVVAWLTVRADGGRSSGVAERSSIAWETVCLFFTWELVAVSAVGIIVGFVEVGSNRALDGHKRTSWAVVALRALVTGRVADRRSGPALIRVLVHAEAQIDVCACGQLSQFTVIASIAETVGATLAPCAVGSHSAGKGNS